ncbi:MAG: hypothetical protein JWM74_2758 [Myxococcaceae bacterium]|nr:hypothetical protein [Myxococcaceae bacterium]
MTFRPTTIRVRLHLASAIAALGATAISSFATPAFALDPEVTSDTAAQFYDVRGPTGETVLSRRRLTTTLGVSAYDLLDRASLPPDASRNVSELNFRARLRYDADYGASPAEADPTNFDRFVPGFSRGPVDLMYGYLEGRKFLGGYLGFKLGRQYQTDALGWWSFDGGQVKVTTPFYVAVEAYGGLEVRGGMPLSTGRFERDGVWRGDRTGLDRTTYPPFQANDVAPAMGVAVESSGVTWLHGRLAYRRVMNTGASNTSMFASGLTAPTLYDGTRVSSERLGYSLDAALSDLGGAKGGIVYDFYVAKVSSLYASIDWFATKKLTASLDYDYFRPTFDGDSIWNFFQGSPSNDIGLRGSLDMSDYLSLSGSAHLRIFNTDTTQLNTTSSLNTASSVQPYFPSSGVTFDEGFNLSANQHVGENVNSLRVNGNFGKEGDRVGGDLLVQRLLENRFILSGRPSIWQWNDKLRVGRDATSFAFVAGIGYKIAARSKILVEYEIDVNRLVGVRNRGMVWLSVAVTK